MVKRLCILGSTGSVGRNALRVVESLSERFGVAALCAGKNIALLAAQIAAFKPRVAVVASPEHVEPLKAALKARRYRRPISILAGAEGQAEAATMPEVDFVIAAGYGTTGLLAAYRAVEAGKNLGLANKEVLVVAGELVTQKARETGAAILPIDSEHSAIHQCLRSGRPQEVRRLILTASGGPFLRTPQKSLNSVTPEQALRHPIWKMGGRITIDSATLMNKGLEIIEAHWLFGLPERQIEVLIHPESLIHSMIEFQDGSLMAQLSVPDMRLPIQYAMTYPDRVKLNGDALTLDWARARRLNFEPPDSRRFPCLELGRAALEAGQGMPCAMNAADEVAVEAFLAHRLGFRDIPRVIENVMRATPAVHLISIEDVMELDRQARAAAERSIASLRPSASSGKKGRRTGSWREY